ncbi:hypothetical protein SteCoe_9465 [Stentor coeruleus]|uniref:Uncharacterized protein n=1 Tax=Stentor coeruleus TaxID=5963 RepID=A0A1R2CI19_9CILI|nr:hypothetical protein SteCoe_9465 [Stentor coeruleus]
MGDLEQFIKVKRGRPRKISKERFKSLQNSFQSSGDSSTIKYFEKQKIYLKENYCQKFQMMLSVIPKFVKFSSKARSLPVLNFLQESAKKYFMNELEIAALSLFLSSVQWELRNYSVEEVIESCCLLSKKFFESDQELLNYLETKLESQYSNIDKITSLIKKKIHIDLKKLNKRLKALIKSSKKFNINYNYYVDEIIRMSPPYNIDIKKQKLDDNSSNDDEPENTIIRVCHRKEPISVSTRQNIFTIKSRKTLKKSDQARGVMKNTIKSRQEVYKDEENQNKFEDLKEEIKPRRKNTIYNNEEDRRNSYESKLAKVQNEKLEEEIKVDMMNKDKGKKSKKVVDESRKDSYLNELVPLDDYEKYLLGSFFSKSCVYTEFDKSISCIKALI